MSVLVGSDGMPPAHGLVGREHDFFPVGSSDSTCYICSDVDDTHNLISAEPVMIHHHNIQAYVTDIKGRDVKGKGFIKDGNECVLLY